MGNSCSSGQAHKDKDNVSQHSEESPAYRATRPQEDEPTRVKEPPPPVKPQLKGPRPVGSSVSDSISLSSPVACASPRENTEGPPVPSTVAGLPEEHRNALLGKLTGLRPRRRKAMLIYVCAADSQDCCAEKGALQCGAAVSLRVRARSRGWRVHVSDLHWRSPLEQQRDHRFPVLCIAELARQSELGAVVPVLFLNSGLGTPLLPHTMECSDFQAALDAAEDENDKALLNKWYSLDNNSTPPCYRLARGAASRWRREMAKALSVLVRTLPQEACDAYLTTVVEQEVQHTVLMSVEAGRRMVWVCRAGSPPAAPPAPPSSPAPPALADPAARQQQRRLHALHRDLKQHLSERNIIRASIRKRAPSGEDDYTANISSALAERLDAILDSLMADGDSPTGYNGIPAALFDEINEHLTFCQKSSQCTSNRDITLNEIKTYITGECAVPLVLLGGAGCGKATLLARAATLAHTWVPGLLLIVRFVGLTSQSSSSHQLLKSIVDQCHVIQYGCVYRGKNDAGSLGGALSGLLAALASRRPVLLAVLGADALRAARWLPCKLPRRVKLMLTVTEEKDEPSSSAIMAVVSSDVGPKVVRAAAVGAEEARGVLAACAAACARAGAGAVPPAAAAAAAKCTAPLQAKILAWQISLSVETFSEQSEPETVPDLITGEDLEGQLTQILITTENALGAEKVRTCLALLSASRRGLDDTEILDLLAHEEIFRSEETYLPWAPASLFWPQLAALLAPWLHWDGRGAARWRDAALATCARERCLLPREPEVRQNIVDYYEGVWYEENDPKMTGRLISQENKFSDDYYNTRKLDELPFQHYHLTKENPQIFAKKPYFTELSYIYDKLAATDTGHYLEDINLVHIDPLPEHIQILKDLFETHSYALDYDHRQFYGLLFTTIEKRKREGEIKSEIVREWLRDIKEPPIPTLLPVNDDLYKLVELGDKKDPSRSDVFDSKMFDLVVRFDKKGRYAATVSSEREEICVWDVIECKQVRKLVGMTHPMNLISLDDHRCVVLCRRELRIYDLDQGKFIKSLKGVMNQQMPYYGLHDANHIVALSRNRMYVYLMNIETDDLVTTFKAGEDRFINSLLVSGDGRILVCGDETQKPFPLLVWSLESRKLLYDLRIPHHDFVTSKAAITFEGTYVCVAARELDEPSPNFIVVYDLVSGTLFKKWKPGVDCVALAISSSAGCVVAALQDARLAVWDLLTGNLRLTLRGHRSPASCLRLARSGLVLAAADLGAADPALRLWDLQAGTLISVYTPPHRITSLDVHLGGAYISLALENYKDLVCLKLHGAPVETVTQGRKCEDDSSPYGDPANEGKTFDVRGAESI